MIGQNKVLNWIDNNIDNNIDNFPRFVVFIAPKGCGKKTIARYIANKLRANYVACGVKVDEVREIIDMAYTVSDITLYCFEDADTMRNEAKNAMLKVTEEPPKRAYFVMTVQDSSSLLDTIKSRAQVFSLEPYAKQELHTYAYNKYPNSDVSNIVAIASTPYEIDMLVQYGKSFIEYVELVIDNISEVQPANAFKCANKISIKENDNGYDLKLFFDTFCELCLKRIASDYSRYATGIIRTAPFSMRCTKLGVNKQQLLDEWIFSIREVWL